MTSVTLARSYFEKARKRLRALGIVFEDAAYSDVVREAQELVELALKGALRFVGIELSVPKTHSSCWRCGVGRSVDVERGRFHGEQAVCSAVAQVSEVVAPERGGLTVLGFGSAVDALAGRGERDNAVGRGRADLRADPLRGPALVVPV
jgi:hypothetical protein